MPSPTRGAGAAAPVDRRALRVQDGEWIHEQSERKPVAQITVPTSSSLPSSKLTACARAPTVPAISFVEQPPTYAEAFSVQRFQASLSL